MVELGNCLYKFRAVFNTASNHQIVLTSKGYHLEWYSSGFWMKSPVFQSVFELEDHIDNLSHTSTQTTRI